MTLNSSDFGQLVSAIGAELVRMALDLSRFQDQLAGADWNRMAQPQALAPEAAAWEPAIAGRIVALQDLDRLTQTAAALGPLCADVGAYLQRADRSRLQGGHAGELIESVALLSLRGRPARALHPSVVDDKVTQSGHAHCTRDGRAAEAGPDRGGNT